MVVSQSHYWYVDAYFTNFIIDFGYEKRTTRKTERQKSYFKPLTGLRFSWVCRRDTTAHSFRPVTPIGVPSTHGLGAITNRYCPQGQCWVSTVKLSLKFLNSRWLLTFVYHLYLTVGMWLSYVICVQLQNAIKYKYTHWRNIYSSAVIASSTMAMAMAIPSEENMNCKTKSEMIWKWGKHEN
jgi:hypothetical protein